MAEMLDVGVRKVGTGDKVVKRSLEDIADSAKMVDTELKSLNKTAAWVGAGIGAALAGTAVMIAKGFADAAKSIKETSIAAKQLGIGVENFSRLDFAARSADLTTKDLVGTIQSLQQAQMQAAKPGSEMNKLFAQMGIETVKANGSLRETEDVLRNVADLFQKMPDGTNKSALALKLFKTENQDVVKLLSDGSKGFDELGAKADEFGYTLDQQTSKSVSEFYDELDDVKLQIEALYRQALPGLLPLLKQFSGLLNSAEFKQGFNTLIQGAAEGVIWLAKLATQFTNTVSSLSQDVAAHYNGAALDDADRVGKELTRVEARIEKLRDWQDSGRVGRAFSGLGNADPFAKSRDPSLGGIQRNAELAAQKELNILTQRRTMLLQGQQDIAANNYAAADKAARDDAEATRKALLADEAAAKLTVPTIDFTKLGRGGAKDSSTDKEAKALERLRNQLDGIIGSINPVLGAQEDLANAQDVFTRSVEKGLIGQKEADAYMATYTERLQDQLDPLGAVTRELEKQTTVAKLLGDERDVEIQMLNILDDLKRSSIKLDEAQTQAMRDQIIALQELNKLSAAKEDILRNSQGRDNEDFDRQLKAMEELLAGGQISGSDGFNQANDMMGGIFDNTQEAYDNQVAQREEYYRRIDELRQLDVINDQTAQQAKQQFENNLLQTRLDKYSTFFGTLAGLASSENKELARIGKAAAVVDATIKGVQAVQNALATVPYPANIAAAAAMGVVAAANVASIISQPLPAFRTGGSMVVGGSGGTDSQTVALRATPGEKININTPAQARAAEGGGDVTVNSPIGVTVVSDRAAAQAQMRQDPNMRQWIIEVIEENSGTVARAIGVK